MHIEKLKKIVDTDKTKQKNLVISKFTLAGRLYV